MIQTVLKRSFFLAAAFAAMTLSLTLSSTANAQSLGARHDLTIGVERVFGLYSVRVQEERGPQDFTTKATSFGLGYQQPVTPLTVPRVAVDFFITQQLSLGGSLGFYSVDPGNNPDTANDEMSGVLFAPRVGYAIPFNTEWGVWFRGGFTYWGWDSDNDNEMSLLALSGEAAFYFMPAPSVGFTGGPLLDLGLSGNERFGNAKGDYDARVFGIGFGMFARL
jgi:hypothetical protein